MFNIARESLVTCNQPIALCFWFIHYLIRSKMIVMNPIHYANILFSLTCLLCLRFYLFQARTQLVKKRKIAQAMVLSVATAATSTSTTTTTTTCKSKIHHALFRENIIRLDLVFVIISGVWSNLIRCGTYGLPQPEWFCYWAIGLWIQLILFKWKSAQVNKSNASLVNEFYIEIHSSVGFIIGTIVMLWWWYGTFSLLYFLGLLFAIYQTLYGMEYLIIIRNLLFPISSSSSSPVPIATSDAVAPPVACYISNNSKSELELKSKDKSKKKDQSKTKAKTKGRNDKTKETIKQAEDYLREYFENHGKNNNQHKSHSHSDSDSDSSSSSSSSDSSSSDSDSDTLSHGSSFHSRQKNKIHNHSSSDDHSGSQTYQEKKRKQEE